MARNSYRANRRGDAALGDAVGASGDVATNISSANSGGGGGHRRSGSSSAVEFRPCQPIIVGYSNVVAVDMLRLGKCFTCHGIDLERSITAE